MVTARSAQVGAAIWMEEPGTAVELAEQGAEFVTSDSLVVTHIDALIAAGRLDEAQAMVNNNLRQQLAIADFRIALAAIRGDSAAGHAQLEDSTTVVPANSLEALRCQGKIG